jgi:hypothetical protein
MRFYLPMNNRAMNNRVPVIAAVLALTVSGCATTTAGTATRAAPPLPATAETLPELLLPAAAVSAAMGGPDLVVTSDASAPWDDSAPLTDRTPGCLAVAGAAQRGTYAGAGFTAVHGQVLREPPTAQAWSHFASQAVVLFPSDRKAADFFSRSRENWGACSNRELAYRQQLAPVQLWSVGPADVDRDVLTVARTQRSPETWSCQRALTVHGTVAIDVEACSLSGAVDSAASIAREISARMGPAH